MTLSPCAHCGAPHRPGTACPSCGAVTPSAPGTSPAQRVLGLVIGAGLLTGCPTVQPPYGTAVTDKLTDDTSTETGGDTGATTTE